MMHDTAARLGVINILAKTARKNLRLPHSFAIKMQVTYNPQKLVTASYLWPQQLLRPD